MPSHRTLCEDRIGGFGKAEREGLRLYPATNEELLGDLPPEPLLHGVALRVLRALGPQTRFAAGRDGVAGFWVSFFIDGDAYWLGLNLERLHRQFGMTIVYATPDELEALSMGEEIAVMRDGAIFQRGTPDHLYDQPGDT